MNAQFETAGSAVPGKRLDVPAPIPTAAADSLGALLVRPDEAARLLAIGRNKVYELMRSGALRSVKIGSSRRVVTTSLAEFVARMSEETAAYRSTARPRRRWRVSPCGWSLGRCDRPGLDRR